MNKILARITIIFLSLSLLTVLVFIIRKQYLEYKISKVSKTQESGRAESVDFQITNSISMADVRNMTVENSNASVFDLIDLNDNSINGKVYRAEDESYIYYYAHTNIPKPDPGKYYRGQLVNEETGEELPSGRFFQNENGMFEFYLISEPGFDPSALFVNEMWEKSTYDTPMPILAGPFK